MEVKLFEVRDRCTFIPCIGIKVTGDDGPLARRIGILRGNHSIMFGRLAGGQMVHSPHEQTLSGRTMHDAHRCVSETWDSLKSGDVIDVEYWLGETKTKKASECTPYE